MKAVIYARYSSDNQREERLVRLFIRKDTQWGIPFMN